MDTVSGESEEIVYKVELIESAEKDFDKLTKKAQAQVAKLIDTLETGPRKGNVRELVGYKGVYRKRTGDYRVVYTIEDDVLVVIVVAVGPRKEIYEMLKRRIK